MQGDGGVCGLTVVVGGWYPLVCASVCAQVISQVTAFSQRGDCSAGVISMNEKFSALRAGVSRRTMLAWLGGMSAVALTSAGTLAKETRSGAALSSEDEAFL